MYMSPKSLLVAWANRRGKAKYAASADISSLSMVFYELVTAEPLIEDASDFDVDAIVRGRRPQFPPGFEEQHPSLVALVKDCWDGNEGARPKAGDIVARMKRLKSEMGIFVS